MTRPDPHLERPVRPLGRGAAVVATAFAVSGVVHLVRPQVFEPIVPRALPHPRDLVLVSGVAELACAAGLVLPGTRRAAGAASAALLVAVFPANVQMAVDAVRGATADRSGPRLARAAVTLARLPLQWPLVRWAWAAGR
ncbi:DoxX family protein [Cellulomonas sp. Marseille-Q8402]